MPTFRLRIWATQVLYAARDYDVEAATEEDAAAQLALWQSQAEISDTPDKEPAMPRFILIDNASGYIWGDTANVGGKIAAVETPIEACRAIDADVDAGGTREREYEEVNSLASNETGYTVYRADINGSEAVGVVQDGQDQDMIEAVQRDCDLVATILCIDAEAA